MNRLAALIDRLTNAGDEARQRLLADYFATTADPDRAIAASLLAGTRTWHRAKLPFIRGVTEARLDPTLFALSVEHVGDPGETIALLWPANTGANRDPSLAEITEGLSSLGKSELPKRIESWLDALDANGRWLLIKLIAGGFRSPVTAANVGHALAAIGDEAVGLDRADAEPIAQSELFVTTSAVPVDGTLRAVLLYVEYGRSRSAPVMCTFGAWQGDVLVPIGKAAADARGPTWQTIEPFVRDNTSARFGPVREVAHTRDLGLVLDVAFHDLRLAPRRKSGVMLGSARIEGVSEECAPAAAENVDALKQLLR